jgi:DNA-binding winged helix-turn-helix (wHTH) protein
MRVRDRSVDVYVRKLRVKLEAALPEWSFIHTHFGLGYRLAADRRHVITAGSQVINTMARPGPETLPDSN